MSENRVFHGFVEKLATLLKTEKQSVLVNELSSFPTYDSLGKIEVAMLIEDVFGVQISQEELNLCRTAQDIFNACTKI